MILKEVMKELQFKNMRGKLEANAQINSDNVLTPKNGDSEYKEIRVKEMIRQGLVLGAKIRSRTIIIN